MIQTCLVRFTKKKCKVYDAKQTCVMEGIKTADNCYMISSMFVCNDAMTCDNVIWHYKLGHLNYHDMKKLMKVETVRGVPNLVIKDT